MTRPHGGGPWSPPPPGISSCPVGGRGPDPDRHVGGGASIGTSASQHRAQRTATLQIITAAEAAGHARVTEMNKQVAANLDRIITALETDGRDQEASASAS